MVGRKRWQILLVLMLQRNGKVIAKLIPSYLTATQPQYLASLSNASKASLRMQGGPFSPEEVEEFKKNPAYKEMVMLRLWDDQAKIVGMKTPPLNHYQPMAERVLRRSRIASSTTSAHNAT